MAMQTKSKINFLAIVLALAFWGWGGNVLAEQEEEMLKKELENATVSEIVVLATVDVVNAKLISNENGELKISFGLSNAIGVQDGVKYAVELRDIETDQLMDRKIFDEALFLGEGQVVEREVSYAVPRYLSGKFRVMLASQNEKGLSFGAMIVGDIETQAAEKGIFLDASNCFLKVSGSDESFNLTEGVDVSREEELKLLCPASSSLETATEAIPNFKTNFRTAFGKTVAEEKGISAKIGAGEKKELSLVVPKANSPQAYDTEVILLDGSGKIISNTIHIHYVLQGLSGTMQNITLDKDFYKKGEVAQISFYWTGRADDFPKSRIGMSRAKTFVRISATNPEGKNCFETFSKEVDTRFNGGKENMEVKAVEDCQDGKIIVALLDDQGNVLDEKSFNLNREKKAPVSKKNASMLFLASMIAGAILLIGVGVILIKKSRNRGAMGMLVLFLVSGLFFSMKSAEAGSFSFTYSSWTASFTYTLSGYDGISGGRYLFCSGDEMWMYMTGSWPGCANTADSMMSTFYQNGANYPSGRVHPIEYSDAQHDTSPSGSAHHLAPLTAGNYQMAVTGSIFIGEDFSRNNSDYQVSNLYFLNYRVDKATNGNCGSADDGNFEFAPSANLCDSNYGVSNVTRDGVYWKWTCYGRDNGACGHTDANCSALFTPPCTSTNCVSESVTAPYNGEICGGGNKTWVCGAGGVFVYTGRDCSCTCAGTGCDWNPVTASSGEVICGSDGNYWLCRGLVGTSDWAPTFKACPCNVDGVCKDVSVGGAHQSSVSVAPTANLCTGGSASDVLIDQPNAKFNWTCYGQGSGTSSPPCYANWKPNMSLTGPLSVQSGGSATLEWKNYGGKATSCSNTNLSNNNEEGTLTEIINATKTYTASCTNNSGVTSVASHTVNVCDPNINPTTTYHCPSAPNIGECEPSDNCKSISAQSCTYTDKCNNVFPASFVGGVCGGTETCSNYITACPCVTDNDWIETTP